MDSLSLTHTHTKFETSVVYLQKTMRLVSYARAISFAKKLQKKYLQIHKRALSYARALSFPRLRTRSPAPRFMLPSLPHPRLCPSPAFFIPLHYLRFLFETCCVCVCQREWSVHFNNLIRTKRIPSRDTLCVIPTYLTQATYYTRQQSP